MYNLSIDEISMVDGGGDGSKMFGTPQSIIGGIIIGEVWNGIKSVYSHNSPQTGPSAAVAAGMNVSSGGYMANGLQSGGGMAGSPTGGRGYGY
ncbi:hypothetical protein [Vibrio sinaloensis]|uniref:hypothetical protein n=1 Tax=Photobacterium sp. (strain ATCC 43367) TaxID=379097 RepID=UPI0035E75543